jgi:hypothetical protein
MIFGSSSGVVVGISPVKVVIKGAVEGERLALGLGEGETEAEVDGLLTPAEGEADGDTLADGL